MNALMTINLWYFLAVLITFIMITIITLAVWFLVRFNKQMKKAEIIQKNFVQNLKSAEIIQKNFVQNLKSGDYCDFYSGQYQRATVTEVDENTITVTMVVNKDNVYPLH